MKPFLVDSIGIIFKYLTKISIFDLILIFIPKRDKITTGALTEAWVLLNFLLSIMLNIFIKDSAPKYLFWPYIYYSFYRIFEIVAFQFYTQIYGGYRGKNEPRLYYTVISYRRSIILAILLYFEIIFWFSGLYRMFSDCFIYSVNLHRNALTYIYYSFVTMTTIGYGDISAKSSMGFILVILQSIIAIFMVILIIARIVSYLPRPNTLDKIEEAPDTDDNYDD